MPIELPQRAAPPKPGFVVTGRMVLFAIIAFFGVVTAVNAVMMTLALRTMPGVDVKSSYEASQSYNRTIARARAQAQRGWTADVAFVEGASRMVSVNLRDRNGEPVRGLEMHARFAHIADRKRDQSVMLTEAAPGRYEGAAAPRGVWDLHIEARQGQDILFQSQSRLSP
ncbi:MAG: FixH family protein [Beijerinckiaceae bacterium]